MAKSLEFLLGEYEEPVIVYRITEENDKGKIVTDEFAFPCDEFTFFKEVFIRATMNQNKKFNTDNRRITKIEIINPF